jgi:perosamine synthetase
MKSSCRRSPLLPPPTLFYDLNPAQIESRITSRTRAIIPVHLFGLPCEMAAIQEIARRRGLVVLEDSCQTMFARHDGVSVGSFGALGCFSTYTAHILVTGVGGLITTNDRKLATLCRSLIAHGRDTAYLSIDDDDGVSDNELRHIVSRRFSFEHLGFSYRMGELEGALGLAQLERRDEIISGRRRNAGLLAELLKPFSDYLQLPSWPEYSDHSFMMFPLVVRGGVDRDDLVNWLERHQIETRYMFPLINQPIYRKLFGLPEQDYPVAALLSRQGFYIGCHQNLNEDDLNYVARVFAAYFSKAGGDPCRAA